MDRFPFSHRGKDRFWHSMGSGVERSVYEKIMCLGISVGLGVVDPDSGTSNGWLDGCQRISESGKMYGQHEREARSISSVQRR